MEAEIAVFLGAGASRDFGIPTVRELIQKLPEPAIGLYRAISGRCPDYPIEDFLQLLTDLEGLEHSEAGNEILRSCGYTRDSSTDLREMRKAVFRDIQRWCKVPETSVASASATYGTLFDLALESTVYPRVFTTNYDDVLEQVCARKGYECRIGFAERSGSPYPVFTNTFTFENLCYFKLHGSTDWSKSESGDVICRSDPCDSYRWEHVLMMYPVKGKPYFSEPFLTLYMHFLRILRQTRIIFVIGSRLADPNVTEPLRHEMASGRPKMWIVDPDASERKRELGWEKGLDNVVPINKGLLDWIESGAPEWTRAIEELRGLYGPNDVFLRSARHNAWPFWP